MCFWVVGSGGLLGSAMKKRASFATNRQEADIADLGALQKFASAHPEITHIVNAAAFSEVDPAEKRREEAFAVNVTGAANLALVAKERGMKLIQISTDYVFGGALFRPLREEDETEPCNYYGETKLAGEKEVLRILPSATLIRTSWIFGDGGKSFVAKLLAQLLEKEELFLTDDQFGRATFVGDLVEAICKMRDQPGLFHFANQGIVTRYQFALVLQERAAALGLPIKTRKIHPVPSSTFTSPARRPLYSAFDTSKIEKRIGAIRPWEEALEEFLHALA